MSGATPLSRPRTAAPEWWRGAVIYQIYPRSFADSNADGIGDLPGITAHLGHVADLGVDAVWLSPFFTSPMKDFGYDVADYRDVDPIFGTLADFDALLAEAHRLGLKVIIDQVYSHTSDRHPWFQASGADRSNAHADWYVWADAKPDGSPPNNWQSVFGGPAWTWHARRRQYYLHNFLPEQPDLNVHHPEVQAALLDVARFWFERGVDGFRLDAIDYAMHDPRLRDNPPAAYTGKPRARPVDFQRSLYNRSHADLPAFIERIRALADHYGDRFLVAEIGGEHAEPEMHRLTDPAGRFHTAYGFNFLYAERLTPELVRRTLAEWPARPGVGWPSWAFSNHDAPRAVSRWATPGHTTDAARLNLLLLACLRGNVFLYQGEELGLTQASLRYEDLKDPEALANWPATLGRDGARTPMPWAAAAPFAGFSGATPWLPIPPEHAALAVDRQRDAAGSTLTLAKALLRLRHASPALRWGTLEFQDAPPDVLSFVRAADGERLLCVFNLGAEERTVPVAGVRRALIAVGGATPERLPPFSGLILDLPA